MSLPHILLGLIAEPMSGYAIKQEFDTKLGHFWFAELSQLYPALKKLEADGLAESTAGPSSKGPPKKLYRRTDAGREELLRWLASEPGVLPIRHPYLAQVFFLGASKNPASTLAFFRELKQRLVATVQRLNAVEAGWASEDPRYPDELPEDEFYVQMTLTAGLAVHTAYCAWCDDCIARIQRRFSLA
ncbi:MAG: hypothetical protein COB37_07440 [Kordiimonadales bacterium]|nr:MAG: hypothetical protein COB37_07440 [Kordiimonadales bacterium]